MLRKVLRGGCIPTQTQLRGSIPRQRSFCSDPPSQPSNPRVAPRPVVTTQSGIQYQEKWVLCEYTGNVLSSVEMFNPRGELESTSTTLVGAGLVGSKKFALSTPTDDGGSVEVSCQAMGSARGNHSRRRYFSSDQPPSHTPPPNPRVAPRPVVTTQSGIQYQEKWVLCEYTGNMLSSVEMFNPRGDRGVDRPGRSPYGFSSWSRE